MKIPAWGKAAAVCAAYAGAFFFVVWVKIHLVRSGYRLQELGSEREKLSLDLAELESGMGRAAGYEAISQRAKKNQYLMPGEYPLERIRYGRAGASR